MALHQNSPRRAAQPSKQSTFFGGAAVLAVGIMVVKLIGMFYKIPLINIIGDQGSADFNNAYNIYAVLLTISTAGLPVAVSKLVSEANATGRYNQVRRTFRLSLALFLVLGVLSFLIMFFGSTQLAGLMNDDMAAPGIRALAPAVICVGCLSAFRGYNQGHGNMTPTAVSQIIEALCKLVVGLGLAYPDILNVDGHLVISKDLANADRVTIVTYGGSGHEPAQAGFVGKGMLDIQAVGDIFAAPNGQLVFDAMKMADKGHGVLLLTLNYAGDQLAGKRAMKLARKAGLNVRQVVTGEEIRYDPNGEDNKRGLAGAVALYHIAAAAAREGKTLEEVAEIAQHYADNMASITVKSTDATHPQNGMSFGDLGETDLMEIGAGQHGEGGGVRVPMMSSKDTVATVAEALCKALDLKPGDKTFVMINGCGATTMMEMLVLFKDTVEFLKAKGIEVVASMVGEILTVQEAAGFQMNIAKWDEEMLRLWNTPCHTPAFSKE